MINIKIVSMTLVVVTLSSNPASAAQSWWEKAASIFKSVDQSEVMKDLTVDEIGEAFKEALRIGAENVVQQLGDVDGFNGDAAVHIPLPKQLERVRSLLAKVGMSGIVDDLELKLNRAAETATPKAKTLFLHALEEMTFEDVMDIYKGPGDSATRYFESKVSASLGEEMRPIVTDSLSKVGAIQTFDDVIGQYQSLPFVPDVKADLTEYVVQKGLEGIFYYMAKEEAAIRSDPVKQSTKLLKRAFGAG